MLAPFKTKQIRSSPSFSSSPQHRCPYRGSIASLIKLNTNSRLALGQNLEARLKGPYRIKRRERYGVVDAAPALWPADPVAFVGGDAFNSDSKRTAQTDTKDALGYLELQWTLTRRK